MNPAETAAILRQFNEWRRGHHDEQPDPREIGEAIDAAVEMIDRLEAAEKAVTEAYQRGYETGQEEIAAERDDVAQQLVQSEIGKRKISEDRDAAELMSLALRAKIAEMERQEPVAWMLNCPTLGGDTGWILSWTQSGAGLCNRLQGEENEKRLYALPGVDPAPSVPDGWKEAAIAWEVCASIHREYGNGKDPFFNTRQGDFVKHANDARAMLAAAPEAKP